MRCWPLVFALWASCSRSTLADEQPAEPVKVEAASNNVIPAPAPVVLPAKPDGGFRTLHFPNGATVEQLRAAGLSVTQRRVDVPGAGMALPAPAPSAYSPYAVTPAAAVGTSRIDLLRAALAKLDEAGAKGAAEAVREEIAREEQSATRQLEKKLAELSALQAEVDRLRRETGAMPQVLVKVKVIDIDVTKLRSVGFAFRVAPGVGPDTAAEQPSDLQGLVEKLTGKSAGQQTSPFSILPPNHALFGLIDMLEKQQVAAVVAEPNLVGYSGRPASFLSGGQFPVPGGPDGKNVTMKNYGTEVDFVPQVLADGLVQLDIRVSVSEIDMTHSVTVGSQKVPALRANETKTRFEGKAGETLMCAGSFDEREVVDSTMDAIARTVGVESKHIFRRLVLVTPQLLGAPLVPLPAAARTAEAPAVQSR
jgi:hypothetical protein